MRLPRLKVASATTTRPAPTDGRLPTQRATAPDARADGRDVVTAGELDAELADVLAGGAGRGDAPGAPGSVVEPDSAQQPGSPFIAPPLVLPLPLPLRRRLALATAAVVVIALAVAGMTVAAEQRAAAQAAVEAHSAVMAEQARVYSAERVMLREQYNAATRVQMVAEQTAAATAGVVVLDAARVALAAAPQAAADLLASAQASIDAASAVVGADPMRTVLTIQDAVAAVAAPLQAAVASQGVWQVAEDARIAAAQAAAQAQAAAAATAAKPRTTTRRATTSTASAPGAAAPAPAPASNVPEFSAGELGGAINAFRASQGLGALSVSRSSSLVAHAGAMAQAGDIWHSGGDKIVGYVQPASAAGLVQAWANSPGHRAWMLKTDTSAMQVGAVVLDGRLYGAVNFT